MSQKIIFLDVDGTLVDFVDGKQIVPQSAIQAIQQARQNSHLVYLCTGRSKAELQDILPIGFDGIIGAAGGYIEHNGEIIFHKTLTCEDVLKITNFFLQHHISFNLESNAGLFAGQQYFNDVTKHIYQGKIPENESYLSLMRPIDQADLNDINKMSFISETLTFEEIYDHFHDQYHLVQASWTNNTTVYNGEISLHGINKATAIQYVLDYLNLDLKDTYGFGDSMNDIEMFKHVNTAIAMGNSMHNVQQYANFITKDIKEDGIEYAMKHFKLI